VALLRLRPQRVSVRQHGCSTPFAAAHDEVLRSAPSTCRSRGLRRKIETDPAPPAPIFRTARGTGRRVDLPRPDGLRSGLAHCASADEIPRSGASCDAADVAHPSWFCEEHALRGGGRQRAVGVSEIHRKEQDIGNLVTAALVRDRHRTLEKHFFARVNRRGKEESLLNFEHLRVRAVAGES